jgi:hypothetical protein
MVQNASKGSKFASDGVRLKGLKREFTLARLLKESEGSEAGQRPDRDDAHCRTGAGEIWFSLLCPEFERQH